MNDHYVALQALKKQLFLLNARPHVHAVFHGPSMLAVKAKIYGVLYKQYSSIAFDETSSYWSVLKSS